MKTLDAYQSELKEKIPTISLLGQLRYARSDLEHLRAEFEKLAHDRQNGGWRTAADKYELALALYLVLEGIYSYNAGAFWTKTSEVLRVAGQEQAKIGGHFRETLKQWQLPTFDQIGGQRHITPILAHAGIPTYCLNDFFDLLDRAVRNELSVDIPTLIDDWQLDGFPGQIDKPVERFLIHGGSIAEDFVERCLELWQSDGPDPDTLELPPRVLRQFDEWSRNRSDSPSERANAIQLSRPRLVAEPYGEGVAIELPPITFPIARAPQRLTWRVSAGPRLREEGTYRRRLGDTYEYATDLGVLNILTVADQYVLTLVADGVDLKSWTLDGPASPPLLAFDAATGDLILDRRRDKTEEYWISAGERWLLYPHGATLNPSNARKVAELPQQDGEWSRFQFESWLFETDGRLDVTLANERVVSFRASGDESLVPPSLLGRPLIPSDRQRQYGLYGGQPPELRIPHGRSGAQPERWRVTISPIGRARPENKCTRSLDTLSSYIREEDSALILSLASPELLGERPFGEFHIQLRGPYGRRAEFQIRIAPELALRDYPRRYLSDAEGPTTFQLVCAESSKPRVRQNQKSITIGEGQAVNPGGQVFTITAPAEVARIPLELRQAESLALDLDIPVYRLRWGLWLPDDPDAFSWQTHPLRVRPQAYVDVHEIEIRVDLPVWDGAPHLTYGWRLIDSDGGILREQPPDLDRPIKRFVQTRLAEWLDDFYHVGQVACLQLLVEIDGNPSAAPIDVAHLRPILDIGNVDFVWDVGDESQQVALFLEDDTPIRNRVLRLWPIDRPWQDTPVTLRMPEHSNGYAEWKLTLDELTPGEYEVEMAIDDPWSVGPPKRPLADTQQSFRVWPDRWVSLRDHQITAAGKGELDGYTALALLHWAVRTRQLDDVQSISYGVQRAKADFDFDQLLLWAELTRDADCPLAYKGAQLVLFGDDQLALLESGDLTDDQCQAYLSHVTPGLRNATPYRIALHHTRGDEQWLCVAELCRLGQPDGFELILEACRNEPGRIEQAVTALVPRASEAADWLFGQDESVAADLLHALVQKDRVRDMIHVGAEAVTNVGVVKITAIRHQLSGKSLKVCRNRRNQEEPYVLAGLLWPDGDRIAIEIDLLQQSLSLSAQELYPCTCCDHVYKGADSLRAHLLRRGVIDFVRPPVRNVVRQLSQLTVTKR